MQSWIFRIITLQSSVLHDLSEIILIWWFAAQMSIKVLIIILNDEKNYDFFSGFFDE